MTLSLEICLCRSDPGKSLRALRGAGGRALGVPNRAGLG